MNERPGPEPPPGPNRGGEPVAPGAPGRTILADQREEEQLLHSTRGQRAQQQAMHELALLEAQQARHLAHQPEQRQAQRQGFQLERERAHPMTLPAADWPALGAPQQRHPAGDVGGRRGESAAGRASGGRRVTRQTATGAGRGGRGRGGGQSLDLGQPQDGPQLRPPCCNTRVCQLLRSDREPCVCDLHQPAAGDGAAAAQQEALQSEAAEEAEAALRQLLAERPLAERPRGSREEALVEDDESTGMDLDAPGQRSEGGARAGPAPAAPAQFTELPAPSEPQPCPGCGVGLLPGKAFREHAKSSLESPACARACGTPFRPDPAGEQRGTLGSPHAWQCLACMRSFIHKNRHKCPARAGLEAAAAAAGSRGRGAGAGPGAQQAGIIPLISLHVPAMTSAPAARS